LLGSASPDLAKGASETLAGRIHFVDMGGFHLWEVGTQHVGKLWVRGAFPDSFLASTEPSSVSWRENFIRTFLERDLARLGFRLAPTTLRRFWTMMAHYHGQTWNGSEIGGALGVSHHATRHYLDVLTGAYMVRQIQPWFENVGKRLVKSPKVYIRDSGLLHHLLGLPDEDALLSHPKMGASWEGFALEQVLAVTGERNVYFWATHGGAELDLLLFVGGKRIGIEFKRTAAPTPSKSMHIAIQDLGLERLYIVYPGEERYPLGERIEALPLAYVPEVFCAQ
jgi:hypothetical protein